MTVDDQNQHQHAWENWGSNNHWGTLSTNTSHEKICTQWKPTTILFFLCCGLWKTFRFCKEKINWHEWHFAKVTLSKPNRIFKRTVNRLSYFYSIISRSSTLITSQLIIEYEVNVYECHPKLIWAIQSLISQKGTGTNNDISY